MQEETNLMTVRTAAEDEDLIDTLTAISIVAKRLAVKLRKQMTDEGGKQNELARLFGDLAAGGELLMNAARGLEMICIAQEERNAAAKETPPAQKTESPALAPQPIPAQQPTPAEETPETARPAVPQQTFTKEQVRALLARKANEEDGKYRAEVRSILKKYGHGGSLTDIDPADYPDVVEETEALTHD